LDPLSGQGSFASLEGGVRAAEAIDAFLNKGEGLQGYADRERRWFAQALIQRSAYYRMERRWSDSPFWRRRHH
jgi:flavin-dependent dehydrogenase